MSSDKKIGAVVFSTGSILLSFVFSILAALTLFLVEKLLEE